MIRKNIMNSISHLKGIQQNEGESIEQKIERIVNNNEPITDGAPIIYMERKEGINPDYDIRTDRWDKALEYTDKITKTKLAKREERHKDPNKDPGKDPGKDQNVAGSKSIPGTEPTPPAAA